MSKVITGAVGAMNVLAGGREIGDATSVTLSDIERPTTEIKGAGIMGTFAMPISGQVNAMTASVAVRAANADKRYLVGNNVDLEIRFAFDCRASDGTLYVAGTKIFRADTRQRSAAGQGRARGARGMRRTITRSCATVRSWTVRKRCWSTRSPAVLSSVERISWVGSAGLLNKEDLYGRKPYNG